MQPGRHRLGLAHLLHVRELSLAAADTLVHVAPPGPTQLDLKVVPLDLQAPSMSTTTRPPSRLQTKSTAEEAEPTG